MLKRLRDWLTRPTWEEYLDEHAECLAVLVELHDLRDEHKFICGEHDRIAGLLDLNAGINADLLMKFHCTKERAEYAERILGEAEDEVKRLRAIGFKECADTPIHSVDIEPDGTVCVQSSPPEWAVKAMAASFAESLDGAPNWRAFQIGPMPSSDGLLIVTVCRKSGDSPVETCVKLKESIEELLSLDGGSLYHPPGGPAKAIFDRAKALINPEKKDA